MTEAEEIACLSALAQPTRLATVRALVASGDVGMRSSEVARTIGTPHNTMSAHLAVLSRAGLVSVERNGREMVYRARPTAIAELGAMLTDLAEPA